MLLQIDDPVSKQPIYTDGSTLVQDLTQDIDKIIALKDSFESREYGRMACDKAKNDRAKDLSNKNKNPQDVHEAAKKNLDEEMVENKIPKVEHEVKKKILDEEMAFLTQNSVDDILSDSSSLDAPSPFGKRSSSNTFEHPDMKPVHLFVDISDIDDKKEDVSEDTITVLKTVKSPKTQDTTLTQMGYVTYTNPKKAILKLISTTRDGEIIEGSNLLLLLSLCHTSDGFKDTLLKGKRSKWFVDNVDQMFSSSGIFSEYEQVTAKTLIRKFKTAIDTVKNKYFTPGNHSCDTSGNQDDSVLPRFVKMVQLLIEEQDLSNDGNARDESIRKKKRVIEHTILGAQTDLGNTESIQVINRTESSKNPITSNAVKNNVDRSISTDATIIISSDNEHTVHDETRSSSFTTPKVTKKFKRSPVKAHTVPSPNEFMGMINQLTNSMTTFNNLNLQNHMKTSTHTSNKPSHISTAEKVEVLYKQIDLYDKKMATIKDKIENETDDNKIKILQDTYDSFY